MRTAIISDIHGNATALDAVMADIGRVSPDQVFHAGDLATHGHRPAEVIDRIRASGWAGVSGNTDEMLWTPELFEALRQQTPKLSALYRVLFHELAPATAALIGAERLTWLRSLPAVLQSARIVVMHAGAGNVWKAPMPDASDESLAGEYAAYRGSIVVYGHIHRPYVRRLGDGTVIANCGSVGLPFDGDPRASYLLIDDDHVEIRRVAYDVEREVSGLLTANYPRAAWLAEIRRTGQYTAPA